MIEVKISLKDDITRDLKEKFKELQDLPQEALKEYQDLTPVDSGRARRNTRLSNDTIKANYDYATRLDQGWSKQAPNGMTEPWNKWMDQRIKKILGK